MYSLHTYDTSMFGHLFIPGHPLESIAVSHWLISVAIQNLLNGDDTCISVGDEVDHALEHYLEKSKRGEMSDETYRYIREQCFCYYVNVSNYFIQFTPTALVDTPVNRKGVAVVIKDLQ